MMMTPADIATEAADLLDMDSDIDVDVTVYDKDGASWIVDLYDEENRHQGSYLLSVEHYAD